MRLKLTFNSINGRKEINRLRHRAKSVFLLSGREPYFSCLQNVGLKEKRGQDTAISHKHMSFYTEINIVLLFSQLLMNKWLQISLKVCCKISPHLRGFSTPQNFILVNTSQKLQVLEIFFQFVLLSSKCFLLTQDFYYSEFLGLPFSLHCKR